jgi:anti-sigma regulatory factor (Ser/Thr protein kinase)
MPETRVNLKHMLENLRDGYPFSTLEETITTELITNALDAQPTVVRFTVDQSRKTLTMIDNGHGMNQEDLERYHDIAETTKVRGEGIGFAGIGAKLTLLEADRVTTETRTAWGFHASHSGLWQMLYTRRGNTQIQRA